MISILSNALNRSNNIDWSLHANLSLSYHLILVTWRVSCMLIRFLPHYCIRPDALYVHRNCGSGYGFSIQSDTNPDFRSIGSGSGFSEQSDQDPDFPNNRFRIMSEHPEFTDFFSFFYIYKWLLKL